MNRRFCAAGIVAVMVSVSALALSSAQQRESNEPEALARGPIHEAFAQPVIFDPKPSSVVNKQPPKPIEEMPPDVKPAGDDVQWISGYWAWDEERADFIWVSGLWRNIPAGLEWTPGYWTQVSGGWQWISGYWAKSDVRQIEYLPEPPATVEYGPATESPGIDYIWAPGCWMWQQTRYIWRPGHWIHDYPGWIWCPCQYVYTPRGYVFVDGFWDYSVRRRGVLFAPVFLTASLFGRPRFTYSPSVVIDIDVVVDHLFVAPRYHHYVFGDYYAPTYVTAGIYPWFSFHMSRFGYEPIYAYYHRHYRRSDADWADGLRDKYRFFQTHAQYRPARTFASQASVISRAQADPGVRQQLDTASLQIAKPLQDIAARQQDQRFVRLDERQRTEQLERQRELHQAGQRRLELEGKAATPPTGREAPTKLERPRTPITASGRTGGPPDRTGKPPLPTVPRIDPNSSPPVKRDEGLPRPESQIERRGQVEPPGRVQPREPPAKVEQKPPPKAPMPPPKGPPAKSETKPPPKKDGEPKKPPTL
jgi:hypothetical protein